MRYAPHVITFMAHVANRPRQIGGYLVANWFVCSMLHMLFENRWNPGSSMWWGVVTVGTQGTKDAVTLPGRVVGAWLILSSVLFFVPVITASITSKLIVNRDVFSHEEQASIHANLKQVCEHLGLDPVEPHEVNPL